MAYGSTLFHHNSNYNNNCSLLFEDEKLSDFTFIIGEEKFPVHKQILASKSKVFFAMFTTDMEESMKNEASITDIDSVVFKELLRFLYSNCLKDAKTIAYELYKVAHKYDIDGLSNLCRQIMTNNVNINNAIKQLLLADQYNDESLQSEMIDYMGRNIRKIMNTEEYKNWYPHASPLLIHLLLQNLSRHNCFNVR